MSKKGNDKLDEAVYSWFVQKRTLLADLCEKAAQLHAMLQQGETVPHLHVHVL